MLQGRENERTDEQEDLNQQNVMHDLQFENGLIKLI